MARSRVSYALLNLVVLVSFISSQQPVLTAIASPELQGASLQKLAQQAPPLPPIIPHFPKSSAALTPAQLATATPAPPPGPAFDWSKTENYLVLGTDQRPGWNDWRTDTVIVVGLDRALHRAAVFSIPRDLFVQVPGYGWARINQVDYMGEKRAGVGGGPALVSQVLSTTLGISTKHWVRLRMDGFVAIVDAVGGVKVHLDCPFYEPIFNLTTQAWEYFNLPAGDSKLDGETAYWFVRLRYIETDIERGRRQRQFLWGLRNQVLSTNLLVRIPVLWNAFQKSFTTDLGVLDMLNLVSYGVGLAPQNVHASGLTLADLQNFTTDQGAAVLRIADPQHVRNVVNNVWSAPAMVDTNHQDTTKCAPLPVGVNIDNRMVGPSSADLANAASLTQTLPITKPAP